MTMMPLDTRSRTRALYATRAVTFGGLSLAAACGTTAPVQPVGDAGPDTGADARTDTGADVGSDVVTPDAVVVPDARIDGGVTCGVVSDGLCADACNQDNDIDCCEGDQAEWEWCSFDAEWGCQCAVEGPFAPPVFRPAA